jgi:hypothetical protein
VQDGEGTLPGNGCRGGSGRIDGADTTRERGPSVGRCDLAIGRGDDEDVTKRKIKDVR